MAVIQGESSMTTPKKTAAPKRKPNNKQKEVTAESFVRMAKEAREREKTAMASTEAYACRHLADIFEAEAKRLRAMR